MFGLDFLISCLYYIGMCICTLIVLGIILVLALCIKDDPKGFVKVIFAGVHWVATILLPCVSIAVIVKYNIFTAIGFFIIGAALLLTSYYLSLHWFGLNLLDIDSSIRKVEHHE